MSGRETKEWMRWAKTPETKASIRRWSRRSDFFFWAGLLLVLGGMAFIGWGLVTERPRRLVFWGLIGVTGVLAFACVGFGSQARGRLSEARFADGYESVGRVDEVITHPGAEGPDTYEILVSAVLPNSVTIQRKINYGAGYLSDEDVGRTIRFRHNTFDPEDLDDVLFDGWHARRHHRGESPRGTGGARALHAGGLVSVGRVDEVISHPGIPGVGGGRTTYSLMVSVELPGPVTLRRQIQLREGQLRSPGRRFGRTIRIHHHTVDPDSLSDAFFDGWPDEAAEMA